MECAEELNKNRKPCKMRWQNGNKEHANVNDTERPTDREREIKRVRKRKRKGEKTDSESTEKATNRADQTGFICDALTSISTS